MRDKHKHPLSYCIQPNDGSWKQETNVIHTDWILQFPGLFLANMSHNIYRTLVLLHVKST